MRMIKCEMVFRLDDDKYLFHYFEELVLDGLIDHIL